MKQVWLFGAGVGSREILRIIRDINKQEETWEVLGFVDKDQNIIGKEVDDLQVVSYKDMIIGADLYAICAIYDPKIRKKVIEEEIEKNGLKLATIIHPDILLPTDIKLADGVMIYPGTQISFNVKLGKGTLIFFNTLLGHDLKAGDYTTVCPSVTLNGDITLGTGAFIGAGATLHPAISIGNWTTIGIGTTVLQNVGDKKKVISMPRQIITDH